MGDIKQKKNNHRNGLRLCNLEKIEIETVNKAVSLNKSNEERSLCIHYRKHFLVSINILNKIHKMEIYKHYLNYP